VAVINTGNYGDHHWLRMSSRDGMETGLFFSLILHVAVIIFSLIALPHLHDSLPPLPSPVIVDVVKVSDITNLPPMPSKPSPQKIEAKPLEPLAKPDPKPVPETPKDAPEAVPLPMDKPNQAKPPEPKPPEKTKKPAEPDFDSVLKTVEKFKPKASESPAPPTPTEQTTKSHADAQPFIPSLPISISEMDAVRKQIEGCWTLPAGAKNPQDLIVEVWVSLNPDGSLIQAKVVDALGRANVDPYYRAAAEAALRALMNPRCTPLKLPADKYEQWKTMTINFDPRSMLGL
jgi:outer membrane biosynthesis protein TonB